MPKFGRNSKKNLVSCHSDIRKVLNEAIKYYDFSVICGYRPEHLQNKAYKRSSDFSYQRTDMVKIRNSVFIMEVVMPKWREAVNGMEPRNGMRRRCPGLDNTSFTLKQRSP